MRRDPHPGVPATEYVYINKEMSLEHIATTVKPTRERIRHRHEKKAPEEDDFESPSLDGRVNAPPSAEGCGASDRRVNPRPSELANFVLPGLRKRAGRALDWRICDAI